MGAWDWGGAVGGAASGAATGTAINPGWGSVIGGVIGGVAGGFVGGGDEGEGESGYYGPQVVTMPQYGFTEPRLKLTSDFLAQNIERMMAGEAPSYWEKYKPYLRAAMEDPLKRRFFGRPGERTGTSLSTAYETGAQLGLGAKGTVANVNKQLTRYNEAGTAIDQYIAGKGAEIQERGAYNFPQLSMNMPKGPDAVAFGPQGFQTPERPNYMAGIMSQVGQYLPYLMGNNAPGTGTDAAAANLNFSPGYNTDVLGPQSMANSPYLSQLEADLQRPWTPGGNQ